MTNPQTEARAIARWYLGSMNDGLFIIDTPPHPSNDYAHHDRLDGPSLVLNVTDLPPTKAQAIVDAHNAAIAAKDAELAKFDFEKHSLKVSLVRAEAAIAEARKVLAEMQPHIDEIAAAARINDEWGRVVTGQTDAARALAEIARRAREGGKVDG